MKCALTPLKSSYCKVGAGIFSVLKTEKRDFKKRDFVSILVKSTSKLR